MEKEKPLPWRAFIGVVLTMLALGAALVLNLTVLKQTLRTNRSQPLASLASFVLLILGLVLIYNGFRKTE